jgi:hypothetical protein
MHAIKRSSRRASLAVALWLALIFLTSSTVVPFEVFVNFVQGLTDNAAIKEWFPRFWLVGWVVFVKGWHAAEYAILTVLAAYVARKVTPWSYRSAVGAALLLAALYAVSDEWHQTFVPGRGGNVRDVIIDIAGAATAASILLWREARRVRSLAALAVVTAAAAGDQEDELITAYIRVTE